MNYRELPIQSVLERYAGTRVLILGASGFIGRWVARLLAHTGATLYLPARDCAAAENTFREFGVTGELLKLDLLDLETTRKFISEIDPDITFNVAGYGIDRSECSEEIAFETNARLPEAICRAVSNTTSVRSWTGQRVVHAGTAMEYGAITGDLRESSTPRPTTPYGMSKLAGTRAVTEVCEKTSLAGLTARLFGVYGPGEAAERLLPSLIAASKHTTPIELTAGLHKRDLTYVEDVAEGLIRLGVVECRPGEVVNVATGKLTPIRSFVRAASRELGIEDERLHFGALATRPEEMKHEDVNCDRLLELTGWQPRTQLNEGIRNTLMSRRLKNTFVAGAERSGEVCELF